MGCPRSLTFVIPGKNGIQITITENAGKLDFRIEVLGGNAHMADLRGLFFHFNESKLAGLDISGDSIITTTQIAANSVINLGQGVNMNGAAQPFDIGLKFGGPGVAHGDAVSGPISFTLAETGALTLDDIAHLEFGAMLTSVGGKGTNPPGPAKVTFVAPAAPDAIDDSNGTHEDVPVTIDVLSNDTDADGDTLVITDIDDGPLHGTVEIAPDGRSLVYTPFEDYAGTDSFTYCVSDGNGGQDSATVTVNIIPVADPPDVKIEVLSPLAGDPVNLVRLRVTATQTDFDGSEFIDKITLGGVPAGVIVVTDGQLDDPGQPDQVVEYIELLLPMDQDTDFNFTVTAESEEEGDGDPDEATATASIPIIMEFNHNETVKTFTAVDQSIWGTGQAFSFDDSRFFGIDQPFDLDVPFPIPVPPFVAVATAEGHVKAGFQSTIHLQAGDIDATVPFDISVDTNYNKTTDALLISPAAALGAGGTFMTTGPEGFFKLDFIFEYLLEAGVEFPIDLTTSIGDSIQEKLIDFDSQDAAITLPLPAGLSISLAWPHLSTNGSQATATTLEGDGASNNFLQINLDVDQLAAYFFPPIGVLDPEPTNPDNFEWLDLDVNAGLNFLQNFILTAAGIVGTITFENGVTQAFSFLSDLLIQNASTLDADDDGQVEFTLGLALDATLTNDTEVGFNVGYSFDLLKNIPIIEDTLFHAGGSLPVASFDVYNDTFALNFAQETFSFLA
jgi:hypothetical protein